MFGAAAGIAIAGQFVNSTLGIIQGVQQIQDGKARAEEISSQIENYQRAERENVMRGLRVPEIRQTIAREDVGRSTATGIEAASKMGIAGLGAMPAMLESEQKYLDTVAAAWEEQEMGIQKLIAQDDARLQNLTFQEERQELAMLGQSLTAAEQQIQSGRDLAFGSGQQLVGGASQVAMGVAEMQNMRDVYGLANPEDQRKIDRHNRRNDITK